MDNYFCKKTSGIWQMIGFGIFLLKIVIPIGLIVIGIIDLSKCVTSGKDDDIKSSLTKLLKKFAFALVIFLLPSITKLIFGAIKDASDSMNMAEVCIECMVSPNGETCKSMVEKAKEERKKMEEELYKKGYDGLGDDKTREIQKEGSAEGKPAPDIGDDDEEDDDEDYEDDDE